MRMQWRGSMEKQGDQFWHDARKERITGSRFGDVLAAPTTKRYKNYMNEIIDSILGVPNFDDDDKPWFWHGKAWEAEAVGEYEWKTGNDVIRDFFIVHPIYKFIGCSPDGYVSLKKINIEIKSHKGIPDDLQPRTKLPSNHRPQVQGQLWCCPKREITHFVDFYKDEITSKTDMTILRVLPDPEYHKKLESACVNFWAEIQNRLKG